MKIIMYDKIQEYGTIGKVSDIVFKERKILVGDIITIKRNNGEIFNTTVVFNKIKNNFFIFGFQIIGNDIKKLKRMDCKIIKVKSYNQKDFDNIYNKYKLKVCCSSQKRKNYNFEFKELDIIELSKGKKGILMRSKGDTLQIAYINGGWDELEHIDYNYFGNGNIIKIYRAKNAFNFSCFLKNRKLDVINEEYFNTIFNRNENKIIKLKKLKKEIEEEIISLGGEL